MTPRVWRRWRVSHEFFDTVGLTRVLGRTFTRPRGPARWPASRGHQRRALGSVVPARPAALGRTIRLDDTEWQVVGVLPDGSDFGTLQVWAPRRISAVLRIAAGDRAWICGCRSAALRRPHPRDNHPIFVIGRLDAGATVRCCRRSSTPITADLEREYPQANDARGAFVEPIDAVVFGPIRTTLYVLVAAVALVLLVACTPTWPTCCWRVRHHACTRSRCARRSARAPRVWRDSSGWRAPCWCGCDCSAFSSPRGAVRVLRTLAPATIPRADELQLDGGARCHGRRVADHRTHPRPPAHAARAPPQSACVAAGRRPRQCRQSTSTARALGTRGGATGHGDHAHGGSRAAHSQSLDAAAGEPRLRRVARVQGRVCAAASRYPQNFAQFPNWPERRSGSTPELHHGWRRFPVWNP